MTAGGMSAAWLDRFLCAVCSAMQFTPFSSTDHVQSFCKNISLQISIPVMPNYSICRAGCVESDSISEHAGSRGSRGNTVI